MKTDYNLVETSNPRNVALNLWKQEWLNKITHLSGTLAINNEYQVKYWSLVFRKTFEDNSILDISIPLVIFNFEQEVGSSTTTLIGDDDGAIKIAEMTTELAHAKAKEILANKEVQTLFKDFDALIVPFMTLHRHP